MNYFFGTTIDSSKFNGLDTDNDGTVSKDEFSALSTELTNTVAVDATNFGQHEKMPEGTYFFSFYTIFLLDHFQTRLELELEKLIRFCFIDRYIESSHCIL